ncbi:MAG: SDR family oxidoreductase [Candidatus Levybacteria bacterium]|nr:SDR family oxidoreductase [Candidatus Levybacteria bacterium]
MKNAIIVGAGYVGGAVVNYLSQKKILFCVYDNLTYRDNYLFSFDFEYGDVRDTKKLLKIIPKYSHIIWLAAIVGDGASSVNEDYTMDVNTSSVEWLTSNYKRRIIFTSTCSVYGLNDNLVNEKSKTNPLFLYANSRLKAEGYLSNKNALLLRLGTAFGYGGEYSRIRMDLAINYMTMVAVRKKELSVFGGKQWRPFIHVRDIGKISVESLDKLHVGIYNVATQNVRIIDIANAIRKQTNCRILETQQKFEDNRSYRVDVSKALKAKFFSENIARTIENGIREIRDLVLSGRVKDFEGELYFNQKYL